MSAPIYSYVIEQFFQLELNPILKVYVYNGYQALAEHLAEPLGFAMVLSLCLLGIAISQGMVQLTMENFVKLAVRMGLIYTFGMNWGYFSEYIVNGIQTAAGQIGDWLIAATPVPLPQFAGSGIIGAMQSVLIEFTKVGSWVWAQGNIYESGPLLVAILIWGFGYAMLMIALFEIVMAKIMLAILFTTAPLFISFTLFKPTQPFFDRWLGSIVGYCFLLIFVSATIALALNFAQWAVGDVYFTHVTTITIVGFVPIMVVCFIGIGVILKISHIAQNIGGSVCATSGTQLLAGAVGGFIGGAMSGGSLTKSLFGASGAGASHLLRGINKLGRGIANQTISKSTQAFKYLQQKLRQGDK